MEHDEVNLIESGQHIICLANQRHEWVDGWCKGVSWGIGATNDGNYLCIPAFANMKECRILLNLAGL